MRFLSALLATGLVLGSASTLLADYPLTLEQRERFDRFLPRTFPKLEARDPVHVVLLSDSVGGGYRPLARPKENNNPLRSHVGVFLQQLAREFFYPGGVHLLNPPEGGEAKLTDLLGDEITLENLSSVDGTILDGLRRVHTDAFVHDPDIILVHYGIYDAFGRVSIDVYKRALQEIVEMARSRPVDVVVLGPGLVNYGAGEIEWGLTRPYSMAAREICSSNGVLFFDIGQMMARSGGGADPSNHPVAAMTIVSDRLARVFHHGPELRRQERVHPTDRILAYLGETMLDELKDGPRRTPFTYAGVANFAPDGFVDVVAAIRNQTSEAQEGTIGALAVGNSMLPSSEPQRFTVPPDATTQISFRFRRPIVGKARDGSDVLYPIEAGDEFARFSFLLENTIGSEIVDLPLRVGPITAVWKSRQFVNVTDRIRVEWDLVNGSDKPVNGSFQVGMGDKVGQPTPFSVSPLGTKTVFSVFEFAPEVGQRFQEDIWIQIDVDGTVTRFSREMEATRDLVLGEEFGLASWSNYVNAVPAGDPGASSGLPGRVSGRFDADEDALYLIARLEGMELPDLGDRAALRARVYLDARASGEVMTFGAVEPFEVFAKGTDGPGYVPEIPLGGFGKTYDMVLAARGIGSNLSTEESGAKRLEIRIPRKFLYRHDWALDSVDSLLGFRLEITAADPNPEAREPFPMTNAVVSHSPTFAFEDQTAFGFSENDARSLTGLRLSRQPVASWSVRIY